MENQPISFRQLRDEDYTKLNQELNTKDTLDVLKWAYSEFGDEIIYACSFGAEGIVLIDLISKIRKDAKVIFLDTNVHFKETYELIKKVQQRYPSLRIELLQPELSLEEQAARYGDELWKSKPDQCCALRKLAPLEKALSGTRAWISGLRREQSPARKNTQYVNCDHKFSSIKVCPLIHWTWNDIWKYITLLSLDYNDLHDKGYPSIGCEHCTLPAENQDDMRSGRWAGFGKTECGLHQ